MLQWTTASERRFTRLGALNDARVLVANPYHGARRAVRAVLEPLGCVVIEAERPAEVLEVARRRRPHVLLLDAAHGARGGLVDGRRDQVRPRALRHRDRAGRRRTATRPTRWRPWSAAPMTCCPTTPTRSSSPRACAPPGAAATCRSSCSRASASSSAWPTTTSSPACPTAARSCASSRRSSAAGAATATPSRSSWSTPTTSRRSTTATATPPATPRCARWPTACGSACARRTSPGRFGGEEFVIGLPDADAEGAAAVAEAVRAAVAARPLTIAGRELTLTVSVGWATWEDDDLGQLLARADGALYEAKAAGRDCVRPPRLTVAHAPHDLRAAVPLRGTCLSPPAPSSRPPPSPRRSSRPPPPTPPRASPPSPPPATIVQLHSDTSPGLSGIHKVTGLAAGEQHRRPRPRAVGRAARADLGGQHRLGRPRHRQGDG